MCPVNPRSLENLVPSKPGDPSRNPTGINQFTYRREFESTIDRLLKGKVSQHEIDELNLPEHIRHVIESGEVTRGEVIAMVTVAGAMAGDEKRLPEVLARLWPKTSKHELSDPDGALTTLAELVQKARGE